MFSELYGMLLYEENVVCFGGFVKVYFLIILFVLLMNV